MDRYVHVIYCDDIRQEVGNKRSFMGVYVADLVVPSFPIALPKLCISVTAVTPQSRPFKALTIKVFNGDATILDQAVGKAELKAISVALPIVPDDSIPDSRIIVVFELAISPFAIDEPGKIRVRLITEDGELQGAALKVTLPTMLEVSKSVSKQTHQRHRAASKK